MTSKAVILLVDDEASSLLTLEYLLGKAGYKVLIAETGETALRRVTERLPDIILLDIMMPGMDGFELCRRLKESPVTSRIPILFMTAAAAPTTRIRGFEAGAVDFISKPCEEQEVLARVETHLTIVRMRKKLENRNRALEKEMAERRLRNSQMRLAQEMARLGYWRFDIATRTPEWSEMMFSILGCDPARGIPSYEAHRDFVHPDDWDGFDQAVQGAIGGRPYFIEMRIVFPDTSIHFVAAQGCPQSDTDGNITSVFGTTQDITDRKRMESALRESKEEIGRQAEALRDQNLILELAVASKEREMEILFEKYLRQEKLVAIGQLTGSIAHELRNPMSAVKQSLFYLKRLADQGRLCGSHEKVATHLAQMVREIEDAERVITDVLQITRVTPVKTAKSDFRMLVDDAITRCPITETVRLTVDLDPDPFMVLADSAQLRQVLTNLLTNAAQATGADGEITVRARQLADEILIEITDTGRGISPGELERIFEPLFTTKAKGTGLGLCVCKQIVDNHRGRIIVTTEEGKGTTVAVTLPSEKA